MSTLTTQHVAAKFGLTPVALRRVLRSMPEYADNIRTNYRWQVWDDKAIAKIDAAIKTAKDNQRAVRNLMVLTENDVVDALAEHLERNAGYRVEERHSTKEHGVDIIAVKKATNELLLVEAKGGTSSKDGSNRFGKPFSRNQAKSHVSAAFYCAAKLRQQHASENAVVALAFPNDAMHRKLVHEISSALKLLSIVVFFVDADRLVSMG